MKSDRTLPLTSNRSSTCGVALFAYSAPHNDPALTIQKKMAVQPELFLVAHADGKVVGTVLVGYDGHRGWIYSLAVPPAFRGKWVGSTLMQRMEQLLGGRGCLKINLQVLAANADIIAFYKTLGFSVEERISMGKVL
jgi:hypothetical protein